MGLAGNNPSSMEEGGAEPVQEKDRLKDLQLQVDEVKNTMVSNVDRMLTQIDNLDNLRNKSEDLKDASQTFSETSKKVARSYWWKNVKLVVVIIVIVLIIVLIIVLLATGVIPTSAPAPAPLPLPTSKP